MFMAPKQQITMTTKSLDRMRLSKQVRFSDGLLVSHGIIQRMIRQYKIRQRMHAKHLEVHIHAKLVDIICTYVAPD